MRNNKPTYSLKGNPFANYKEFAEYSDENIGIFEAKCSGSCGQCSGGNCSRCSSCGASFKKKAKK